MRLAAAVLTLAMSSACASTLIGNRIDTLDRVVKDATERGAARCAPVELALSSVHLEFARLELRQGDIHRAERHLTLAEPNGQAALRLTKDGSCPDPVSSADRNQKLTSSRPPRVAVALRGAPRAER